MGASRLGLIRIENTLIRIENTFLSTGVVPGRA